MNWEIIGIVSEVIASVAVVASLFYLARQIRQAKHEISLVGRQARANHATGVLQPLITSSDLPEICAKLGMFDYGDFGLSKEESIRFGAWFHSWLQTEQGCFYLLPEGANDSLLRWMLSTPAGLEFWEKNKGIYDAPFVQRVEMLKSDMQQVPRSEQEVLSGAS